MTSGPLSRRALIAGIAGLAAYGLPVPAAADYLQRVARQQGDFSIRPRSDWAGDGRPPKFALETEDVQLLVVHHTLIPSNNYREDQVPKLLRDIYDFHTGPEKQWADTAYNFMVDQYGGIWETREGSIAGPVAGSATGGNQGFTQLCCFLGDLSAQPPTEPATASMAWLLAQLADRYDLDTTPGTTVDLISRGSSRFAAGAPMTLSTLSGHRDVSLTACPGDAGYAFLQNTLPALVNDRRVVATTTTTSTTTPPTTAAPTTAAPTTAAPTTAAPTTATPSTAPPEDNAALETAATDLAESTSNNALPFAIGGAAVVATGIGVLALAKTRGQSDDDAADAVASADGTLRADGTIDLPARLGGSIVSLAAVSLPPLPGPQRVWWAVEGGTPIDTERAVEELSREVHSLAVASPGDPNRDRQEWSRVDSLLTKRAVRTTAAIVAARSDSVYVLRSEPCLVVVTRPDGVEKRDFGEAALSVARADVASVAVHFTSESAAPDIEVTAK